MMDTQNMSKNNLFLNKIFEDAQKSYQIKKYEKAKVLFEKELISIPKHFPSIFLLGTLLSQIKDHQSAKKLLLKAIKINPNYAEAHNNLGNVYQELNDNLKAIICFQKAINIKPNFLIATSKVVMVNNPDKVADSLCMYSIHADTSRGGIICP